MLGFFHFWAAFFGLAGLLLLLAWLGSRRRRLTPVEVERGEIGAVCGKCGYDVRGLPSVICPECGSDLEEVGRVKPTFARWQRIRTGGRVVVWTAAALMIGGLMSLMAGMFLPVRKSYQESVVQWVEDPPRVGIMVSLGVERWSLPNEAGARRESEMRNLPFKVGEVTVIVPPTRLFTLNMRRSGDTWIARNASGVVEPVGEPAVRQLLADAGYEQDMVRTPSVVELVRLVLERQSPYDTHEAWTPGKSVVPGFVASHTPVQWQGEGPPWWLWAMTLVFWLPVWVVGLFFVTRRRPLRPAVERPPEAGADGTP